MLAQLAQTVDQERLDVRLRIAEDGIFGDEILPCFQRQKRFGGPRGTRIEGNDPLGGLLWMKKARLIGRCRLSHWASVKWKSARSSISRGTRR